MALERWISDAEWDVMQVVWRGGAVKAAHVIAAVATAKGWNHRTVRTLLARLVNKGFLKYEAEGRSYVYRPAISRRQCVRRESRSFLEKVFGGDVGSLLVHFVRDSRISEENLARLRKILDGENR